MRRAERAGGVLLASRLWRLPRRTTHIVASRTKKREETRRKERSRSTGQKRNGREKRKPMRKGRATRTRETNGDGTFCSTASTSLRHSLCCVHQPSPPLSSFLFFFRLSFLSFRLTFRSVFDRYVHKLELTIIHSLHGRPLRFMSLSSRQCVD